MYFNTDFKEEYLYVTKNEEELYCNLDYPSNELNSDTTDNIKIKDEDHNLTENNLDSARTESETLKEFLMNFNCDQEDFSDAQTNNPTIEFSAQNTGSVETHMKWLPRKKPAKTLHKCTICDKVFKTSSNLTVHIKRHNGEKSFSCNMCTLSFVTNVEFKAHIRTHTGERPFACKICGKSFIKSCGLSRHNRIHTMAAQMLIEHFGR